MRDLEICYNIFIGKNTSTIIEVQSSIVIEYSDRVSPPFFKNNPLFYQPLPLYGKNLTCPFSGKILNTMNQQISKKIPRTRDAQDWVQTSIKLLIWAIHAFFFFFFFSKTGPQQFVTFLKFWGNLASCEFSHFWECEIVKFRSKSGKNGHKCTDSKPLLKTKPQQFDLSKVFSNNAKFHKPKWKASVEIMVLCLIYTWSHYFQIWHIKDNLVDLDILNISL